MMKRLRSSECGEITGLLEAWSSGRADAVEELMRLVYNELHKIAQDYMRRRGPGQTLQATALINEAYLHLAGTQAPNCKDRAHFYAIAAQVIRRILVDATRARRAAKRDGDRVRLTFSEQLSVCGRTGWPSAGIRWCAFGAGTA